MRKPVKIVLSISGGTLNAIYSNCQKVEAYLVDYDNLTEDSLEDCSHQLPVDSIMEFLRNSNDEKNSFPGIERLFWKLSQDGKKP